MTNWQTYPEQQGSASPQSASFIQAWPARQVQVECFPPLEIHLQSWVKGPAVSMPANSGVSCFPVCQQAGLKREQLKLLNKQLLCFRQLPSWALPNSQQLNSIWKWNKLVSCKTLEDAITVELRQMQIYFGTSWYPPAQTERINLLKIWRVKSASLTPGAFYPFCTWYNFANLSLKITLRWKGCVVGFSVFFVEFVGVSLAAAVLAITLHQKNRISINIMYIADTNICIFWKQVIGENNRTLWSMRQSEDKLKLIWQMLYCSL